MRVMLSARTLFRRCRSHPGGKNSVRRVCDRPRGITEIPRQSFYSSSRPDVTLLSTPFGTTGSLVRGIIQHAKNSKRERGGEGDLPPLQLYEERKSDFSYMPTAKPPNGPSREPPLRISLDSHFKGGFYDPSSEEEKEREHVEFIDISAKSQRESPDEINRMKYITHFVIYIDILFCVIVNYFRLQFYKF